MSKNKDQMSEKELLLLFNSCIENATYLYNSASDLAFGDQAHIALGLAEIALEELGKSFTCLAYCSVCNQDVNWKTFWDDWRDHDVKAHRAFLYEFFCLIRFEFDFSDDYTPSKRKRISLEKSASLYVDFNKNKRKPIIPIKSITQNELLHRVTSVLGPMNAAYKVCDLLQDTSKDYRRAVYDYAFFVMTTKVFQQQISEAIAANKTGNADYDRALDDILGMFLPKELPENAN